MPRVPLTRRDLFERCAVLGALIAVPALDIPAISAFWEQADALKPTPPNALGPFYKKRAPEARVLRMKTDAGMPLAVAGRIIDTRGEAVRDATVEIWHADHGGHYDIAGYRFRAKLPLDAEARY